jgi:ubiquitin-like 1-activating enzyme E1 B
LHAEFFKLSFGIFQDSMLFEDPKSGETSVYMQYFPPAVPTSGASSSSSANVAPEIQYGCSVVKALFNTEIHKRIDMDTYKTAKKVPQPLDLALIDKAATVAHEVFTQGYLSAHTASGWDRQILTEADAIVELMLCIAYYLKHQQSAIGGISFDKDDDVSMRFVSAAANLRCRIFHIPAQSYYDAKGIAGNIIPAIATTNAIVAGIQVMYAVNLLKPGVEIADRVKTCKHTYCLRAATRRGLYIQPTDPEEPRSECFVCQTSQVTVQVRLQITTILICVS